MKISVPVRRKLPAIALMVLLGGVTLTSSVAAMGKIVKTFKAPTKPLPQLASSEEVTENEGLDEVAEQEIPEHEFENEDSPLIDSTTGQPLPGKSNLGSSTACIVTLFGKQYDVTPLRKTHGGGDIFVCNTDMSTTYKNQHGTDVSRMQQYLINTSSQTSTTSPTNNTSSGPATLASNSNQCLVTLFGQMYDVAPLRNSHPGGDIFVCNTDMSTTYKNQHGTDVSRMQQYRVSGSASGTSGNTSSGSNWPSAGEREHEDEARWEAEKKAMEAAIEAAKKAAEQEHEAEDR